MIGKLLVIITNITSLLTIYTGYIYHEYIIALCVAVTSIMSLLLHLFTEYEYVSDELLNLFRLLDFVFSYMSVYIVTTNFLLDYNNIHFNYHIMVTPVLISMAYLFTCKDMFLSHIVPCLMMIIMPILIYDRKNIIIPKLSVRTFVLVILVMMNILTYQYERDVNYYYMHSIHHIICFTIPGVVVEYKHFNRLVNIIIDPIYDIL